MTEQATTVEPYEPTTFPVWVYHVEDGSVKHTLCHSDEDVPADVDLYDSPQAAEASMSDEGDSESEDSSLTLETLPEDWEKLHHTKLIRIANTLEAGDVANKAEAVELIKMALAG